MAFLDDANANDAHDLFGMGISEIPLCFTSTRNLSRVRIMLPDWMVDRI